MHHIILLAYQPCFIGMQSSQLLPHLSCVKVSLSYYRELLQKLRSQQSTVEESSLLFQQARQQVLRNLRLRLHAHAITIDPKRAFRRLKDRAAEARRRLAAYGMAKAQRAKTKYQAAYRRITSTPADKAQRLQELMYTNPILRVRCSCVCGCQHRGTAGARCWQCGHREPRVYAHAVQHHHTRLPPP